MNITETAAIRLQEILREDNIPNAKIRIYVEGGGCSGFQYGFSIEEDKQEDDFIFEEKNVQILVDPISFSYLEGITVDFKNDINGERFAILNPQAASTCGCGSSFSPY
jgi:iron-sulfur cluster insertion protein